MNNTKKYYFNNIYILISWHIIKCQGIYRIYKTLYLKKVPINLILQKRQINNTF